MSFCGASFAQTYPYSLVPGGVYSPEAFTEHVRPAMPEQYAGIGTVHLAQVRRERRLYASYRNGKIYWTAKPLTVHARELILTDDQNHWIRTRCGNRLSTVPMAPTELHPPPLEVFDTPLPIIPEVADLDSVILPWTAERPLLGGGGSRSARGPSVSYPGGLVPSPWLPAAPAPVGWGLPDREGIPEVIPAVPRATAATPEPACGLPVGIVLLAGLLQWMRRNA